MSDQKFTPSRRTFLKGAAYTSILSMGAMSNLAFAACANNTHKSASASSVTLLNQSDKSLVLDSTRPMNLKTVDGWVVVEINKSTNENILNAKTDDVIVIKPGQQLSFDVDSKVDTLLKQSGEHVVITSEFDAFNNMVPISTYDTLIT